MNWTVPEGDNILRTNAARYDRLRVQAGAGENAGKFRAVMTRVPASPNSTRVFSGWFADREGAEGYIKNLAAQLGASWIKTEQNEYLNFALFDNIEVRQQVGGEQDGKWKAWATRIVGGVEEAEDLSNWKAARAGALAAAQEIIEKINIAQATILARLSGAVGGGA